MKYVLIVGIAVVTTVKLKVDRKRDSYKYNKKWGSFV